MLHNAPLSDSSSIVVFSNKSRENWSSKWIDIWIDIRINFAVFKDPHLQGENKLVLCETYTCEQTPHATNHRAKASQVFERVREHDPWFGLEQEYSILDLDGWPLGWPKGGYPKPQGQYFCGVGAHNAFGRDLVEAHVKACLYAGVRVCGTNAEIKPSQWEFQIGMWILRVSGQCKVTVYFYWRFLLSI